MKYAGAIAVLLLTSLAHANVTYYGGPVVSSTRAVAVYWGGNVDAQVRAAVPGFFTDVLASSYIDLLAEYDTAGLNGQDGQPGSNQRIARGSFVGEFMITPSTTATTLTNTQVESELVAQVAAGHVPAPELDALGNANTIYFVFFPQGTSITYQGNATSCQQWCAVHISLTINGHTVPYAMIPDMAPGSPCNGGCGTNANYVDNVTMYLGHELGNSITDPAISLSITNAGRPMAWFAQTSTQNGEIGTICNQMAGTVAGHTVQKLWSNRQAACVLSCSGASCPLPVDAGVPDAAIPDASATGGAGGSGGTGGTAGSSGSGGSGGSSANSGGGGCGCDVSSRLPASPWLLMAVGAMIALRRRAKAR